MKFGSSALALLFAFILGGCSSAPKTTMGFDPELSNYEYPRKVHFFDLDSQKQKLRMAYIFEKPENFNGRTVLLLHGKNFSSGYWHQTLHFLLEEGFQVLAPDQIGFGKSSKPATYQFSLQGLAHNTQQLLKHLGLGKVSVLGHSMGGMLATRFALEYPQSVERLLLVNPIGLEDWQQIVPYKPIDEIYDHELKATRESIKAYQRSTYFDGEWKPEYEALIEVLAGWTEHPEYPTVAWNAALTTEMIFTQPVVHEFKNLKPRTLLLIGQRDRTAVGKAWAPKEVQEQLGNYPALGKRTARLIPQAELVEFKGVGHMPQVEAFEDYKKTILTFLKRR